MPVARAVRELISDDDAPWSLTAIALRLCHYDDGMSYWRVYRAYRHFYDDAGTRALVVTVSRRVRPLEFGGDVARRIARQALDHETRNQLAASSKPKPPAPELPAPET